MVNILEKGFNHVGLRLHFFDTFVWDVCVGFADLHRSSRQKIKTPLNLITLEELLSSVHRKKIILATTLKAGCTGDLRVSFFFT